MKSILVLSEEASSNSTVPSFLWCCNLIPRWVLQKAPWGRRGLRPGPSRSRSSNPFAKLRIFSNHLLEVDLCFPPNTPPPGCPPPPLVPQSPGNVGWCRAGTVGAARPLDAITGEEARTGVEAGGALSRRCSHTHKQAGSGAGQTGEGEDGLTRSMNVRNFQLPP